MNPNISSSGNDQPSVPGDNVSLKDTMKSNSIWLRLFFMIVMAMLYSLSRVVVGAIALVQFFWVLFTQEKNLNLMTLSQSLASYAYQTSLYLTFNTEVRPFPFDADWPN